MGDAQTATNLLNQMEGEFETEFLDGPYVVMMRDPLLDTMPKSVVGPFPSVIDALAYAERIEKDLRTHWERSDPMPVVAVAPLLSPEKDPNVITA
jgi:hypothetical protein